MRPCAFLYVPLLLLTCASAVQGQSLAERYRNARFRVQAERILNDRGLYVRPMDPLHVPSRADTINLWLARIKRDLLLAGKEKKTLPVDIESWRFVRRFERGWFNKKFDGTLWAYLGTESLLPLDTTATRDLRARLEAHFGPPTQTIAELFTATERSRVRDRFIQFEYWFILNDSIPLVFMDVNGPLERGLIISSDERYRDILIDIREAFLEEFMRSNQRAPYLDYYFDVHEAAWYHVGFDGKGFLMEPIGQPNFALGRPWIQILNRSD